MKLRELEASFIRYEQRTETWTRVLGDPLTWKAGDPTEQVTGPRWHVHFGVPFTEAQGVNFRCPLCQAHYVQVSFAGRGVADDAGSHDRAGAPSRWTASGTSLADLTLQPSIDISNPKYPKTCQWHGWVRNGSAE